MTEPSRKFPIGLTITTAIAFALLIGLGVWQVKRLHWKEALLAKIAALEAAQPRPVNDAVDGRIPVGDLDFIRVSAVCPDIETTPYLKLYAVREVAGFRLITPCVLAGARYKTILVDRGFVSQDQVQALKAGQGERLDQPIVGVLRKGDARNFLTPENTPDQGLWYWRDIPAMARSLGAADPAPTFLMLERPGPKSFGPTPAPIPADIPNNHLQYALTWFGLAASLLGVYVAMLRRRLRP
jgi:surfeit locus 1 family protein